MPAVCMRRMNAMTAFAACGKRARLTIVGPTTVLATLGGVVLVGGAAFIVGIATGAPSRMMASFELPVVGVDRSNREHDSGGPTVGATYRDPGFNPVPGDAIGCELTQNVDASTRRTRP